MDKAEETHQWKITTFAVIGALIAALIGGGFSLLGTIIALNQQQQALNQQQMIEQQNIAHAIYIDISDIEDRFNRSMNVLPLYLNNNTRKLNDPDFALSEDTQYYSNNRLYYVFGKDISKFDSVTSEDLYEFYNEVLDIEIKRAVISGIMSKIQHGENISLSDRIVAHGNTEALYGTKIPYSIKQAEKIKQELRQKYHVKIVSYPMIIYNSQPETFDLGNGYGISVSYL